MSKHNDPEWWEQLTELENDLANPSPHHIRLKTKSPSKKGTVNPGEKEMAALAAHEDSYTQYTFTYQAARHESQWLMESLGSFYHHRWIDDVLRMVKGGKEASVYLCQGGSATKRLLAAKVYRPRMLRNLKNDALYKEGRTMLDEEGHEILDGRMQRAIRKRTGYGLELSHTSWLQHETTTLQSLSEAGCDVPQVYTADHNAILMDYIGDEILAAPTLNTVRLDREEAGPLYQRVIHNIDLMLSRERVHGDLSAYNILYWEGQITLIDFPQAIHPRQNRSAFRIFQRDVRRVCEYFSSQGVVTRPGSLAAEIWTSHGHRLELEIDPAILDDQDEKDVAYWKSLQRR
jgi:RIO kinase 1